MMLFDQAIDFILRQKSKYLNPFFGIAVGSNHAGGNALLGEISQSVLVGIYAIVR